MLIRQRRYSKEELARCGDEIYYRIIHPATHNIKTNSLWLTLKQANGK